MRPGPIAGSNRNWKEIQPKNQTASVSGFLLSSSPSNVIGNEYFHKAAWLI